MSEHRCDNGWIYVNANNSCGYRIVRCVCNPAKAVTR